MLKHYVKVLYPGTFVSNEGHSEIPARADFTLPDNAFGFQFYDKESAIVGSEELLGQPKNFSKTFYKGDVLTLEQVKHQHPESRILISNMENNNWGKVIKCAQGFLPYNESDSTLIQ